MAVAVHMLRRRVAADVDHAGHMAFAGQAWSDGMLSRQCIGDRRRQHAQQIDQGDDPPCFQPLHSGKTDQHLDAMSLDFYANPPTIDANPESANIELHFRRLM